MLPNWFRKIYLLAFCILFNCSSKDKHAELLSSLEAELKVNAPIEEGYIFFVTENDCVACSVNTYESINSIVEKNLSKKKFGLYLSVPRKNSMLHVEFIETTKDKIQWSNTHNTKLFGIVSQNSNKHHSPFVIIVEDNKIREILSLSKG